MREFIPPTLKQRFGKNQSDAEYDNQPEYSERGGGNRYPPRRSGKSWLMIVLYLAALCLAGSVIYKFYKEGSLTGDGVVTNIPKDIQITYVPSDFKPSVDEAQAVKILSDPNTYKKEFNDLVYQVNMDLLNHVGARMGLPNELKKQVEKEYKEKHHPYLKQLYYNDFIQLKDTTSILYQSFYNNNATSAVETLNEVASKYTCFLVNSIVISLQKSDAGRLGIKGLNVNTPCGVAMSEGLQPLMKRLKERAAIDDFSKSKGMINERVERYISELATFEIKDKKGIKTTLNTKLLGYDVSSTEIEIIGISVAKLGFKLDQFLNINLNPKSKRLEITLPAPTIISHEVYPKMDKLDVGWLRGISADDFNKNFNTLRTEFRRDALEEENLEKAKTRAKEVMEMIFKPVLSRIGKDYKLSVSFKNTGGDLPDNKAIE
jgi:hypothetical protein